MLFAVACESSNTDDTANTGSLSLTYAVESIADHEAVVIKPEDIEANAPVVVVLAEDLELRTLAAETPDINFKAAEHCLIGRYVLCVVSATNRDDLSFLTSVNAFISVCIAICILKFRVCDHTVRRNVD